MAHARLHDHSDALDGTPIAVAGVPNLPASKITSGQFPLDRMPRGADSLVLTGTGVGSNPAYEAVAGIPSGLIAMWHGTIVTIPAGYVICDGNNSTPNLLAKFVEGVATAATNPGATGGSTSKTTSKPGHDSVNYSIKSGRYQWYTAHTHNISDIRPLYYDIAFIMKT